MNCLICGSNKKRVLTKLCSNMQIMGASFPEEDSYIVACPHCGHVYVDINVSQEAFTEYYSSAHSKSLSYYEIFGRNKTIVYYTNIMNRIARNGGGQHSRILDWGGGIGELAEFLRSNGYTDVTVLEPSMRCINICREKGIPTIYSDGFDVPDEYAGKFDFVIVNHTLEHIIRFDKSLVSIRKMLNDAGRIYIEVPDAAMYASTNFVPYWFFTYEHIFHMVLKSFDNLAASFGLRVVEAQSYKKCDSYHVIYGIFEKSSTPAKIEYSDEAEMVIRRYLDVCEDKLRPVIEKLAASGEPLILWGIGASTAQLLEGNFDTCNVIKLVDSNPYRQKVHYNVGGRQLNIEDPSTIGAEGTILILPLMYDSSIRKQIQKMGLKNKVLSLIENYK